MKPRTIDSIKNKLLPVLILKALGGASEPVSSAPEIAKGIALMFGKISGPETVPPGILYPALERLHAKGMIEGVGRCPIKYRIQPKGRADLAKRIQEVAPFLKTLSAIFSE